MNAFVHERRLRPDSARGPGLILQLLGAVLVVSSVVVVLFASHASAASLSNGTVTLRSSSGAVATNPLASGQVLDVSVSANSTLSRSSLEAAGFPSGAVPIKVLECSDTGGQQANLPKEPSQCDPSTIVSVAGAQEDGSLYVKDLTIYALPDVAELGPSNGTVCDDAAHQCVLGIFSNQNDFSKPHLFSAPFQITSTAASNGAGSTNVAGAPTSSSAGSGASAAVSVPSATLANTGGPSLWPWLLGAGVVLLLGGSFLRRMRRPTYEERP